jgi:DNA-binding NtrC family response regulator
MEASNPDAALSMARSAARPIDLLISDVNLGSDKDGIELAREIASANPRLNVLLISGGPKPERDMPCGWRFLAKPFKIAEFLIVVRDSLATVKAPRRVASVMRGGAGGLAAGGR